MCLLNISYTHCMVFQTYVLQAQAKFTIYYLQFNVRLGLKSPLDER